MLKGKAFFVQLGAFCSFVYDFVFLLAFKVPQGDQIAPFFAYARLFTLGRFFSKWQILPKIFGYCFPTVKNIH
jgi:hypothetical protein